ncbi:double-cubane-cluster-containing anaerobic reductase [Tepidibacter formicigenes]|jgi:benzoyl-CoA reductase/2-hydroxyglutaryl-CoA dehydratase subunit BcrC/BadD/HgdB|uniref:Benzoyl-CoA reductase/2-hydroxyglutaryl-CoA dehydratase subunit, BcrC/BadD/HgdB n=1 Tax=Tepidibacter formicigenes DSM 15518 TaxID=1123349 RepID=A0A1M6P431_9FIRM|nr:double-cubane-cluster-containing anaerobic reductase [Tepidibacter formicigenes]SHK02684.1 Benzoyl-CoA reductase/2-hydroxyglutaryl-CoA dehydratase subunit, BcrC/BadD/HgdB [Tepidibacter formicigenes DSM 15518]
MADYRKMWEELDMDLEKHDGLCEVLPMFYDEVYLSQENRPENINYYNFVISEVHGLRIKELQDSKQEGKKVIGSFCVYVPDEITLSLDSIPVGICSGSQFWVPDGEKLLPRNTCPLIKASIGAKLSKTCPYFQSCDMVVGETTCDGKKKAWEILGDYMDVHVMDLPQMKREKDKIHWIDEIRIYKELLEEKTGRKLTFEDLKEKIELVNEKRRILKRLYDFRKYDPVPISGKDALLVSQIAFYDDINRFIEMTNKLCDELEERVKNEEGVFEKNAPRIMITGTPMSIPNWKMHHIVETSGGVVVCEETCTGTRYFENEVSENANTIEEQFENLANRYLGINCACFTPNKGRIKDILKYVEEYKVDAVIYNSLQFCSTYAIEYKSVEKALKEKGIPVIMIETDYSDEDTGQIKTRVEALIEIVKEKKGVTA